MGLRSGLALLGAVGVIGFAMSAFALESHSLNPTDSQLTWGSEFEITGSGFGEKKPKVQLVPQFLKKGPKPITLKVLEFSDTRVKVMSRKGLAGSFRLSLKPKGGDTITSSPIVSIVNPNPTSLSIETADPNEAVTITGTHFGTKKGKVYVGSLAAKGKPGKTKVTAWTNTSITFLAPKKQPNGTYAVNVINKAGAGQMANALTIANSNVGLKPVSNKDSMKAVVSGKAFAANVKPSIFFTQGPGILTIFGLRQKISIGKGQIQSLQILVPINLDTATFPVTLNSMTGTNWSDNTYTGLIPGVPKVWTTDGGLSVTISNYVNGRISVTFSGSMQPGTGSASGTKTFTKGSFSGTVPNK